MSRFICNNHTKYNIGYHIIFCPKYRRKVLTNGIDERLKSLLNEKADELEITIEEMEVMPDHVHLFVRSKPTISPHEIVKGLKGYSSSVLRKEYPELKKRLPSLWTRGYYVESVGHISSATIAQYISEQKRR